MNHMNHVYVCFSRLLPFYLRSGEDMQAVVRDMVEIVNDPASTDDERHAAVATIADALSLPTATLPPLLHRKESK
jgi:hypothetical protein